MAAFFWLSVISFDLWQNFRITGPIRIGQRKRFIMYSAYAWGVPFCLTCIVMIIQNSNIDSYYKPGIGDDYCWLKSKCKLYFYLGNTYTQVVVCVYTHTHIIFVNFIDIASSTNNERLISL